MHKKEVVAFLEASERSVENYVKRGMLSVRYEKGKTRDVAVFDPEEVRRLKAQLEARRAVVPTVVRENAENPEQEYRNTESLQLHRPEIAPQSLQILAALPEYLSRIASALEGREAPELLTPEEVADRLKLKVRTVLRLVREGKLLAVRVGRLYRFRPSDLRAFIESL